MHFLLTKLSTSILEFTAHCKVPMMFIAKVRIIPAVPGPSPVETKSMFNFYANKKPLEKRKLTFIS